MSNTIVVVDNANITINILPLVLAGLRLSQLSPLLGARYRVIRAPDEPYEPSYDLTVENRDCWVADLVKRLEEFVAGGFIEPIQRKL